jgi:hypothetical protein
MAKDRRADYLKRADQCRAHAAACISFPAQEFWAEAAKTWNELAEIENLISQIEPTTHGAPTEDHPEPRSAVWQT